MIVRNVKELAKIALESKEPIDIGYYGNTYKIDENYVLKKFNSEELVLSLEKNHTESFLDYLNKLSDKESKILVTPEEVFKDDHGYVWAYISKYVNGKKLSSEIGEVDINSFVEALRDFYKELKQLDNLVLYNANETNLILGRDLKLTNLDLARFERYLDYDDVLRENLQRLNVSIYRSVIGKSTYGRLLDVNLREIVDAITRGEDSLPILLTEYIEYINRHYFEVKHVKDLRYPYGSTM